MARNYTGEFGDEKPFNFAQLLLERLNLLFTKGNEARIEGEVFLWYRFLGTILSAIVFKLDDKEVDDIQKELNKVRAKIKIGTKNDAFYFDIESSLDKVEKDIVKLMYKYGLYYPIANNKTFQEKAKDEDK